MLKCARAAPAREALCMCTCERRCCCPMALIGRAHAHAANYEYFATCPVTLPDPDRITAGLGDCPANQYPLASDPSKCGVAGPLAGVAMS